MGAILSTRKEWTDVPRSGSGSLRRPPALDCTTTPTEKRPVDRSEVLSTVRGTPVGIVRRGRREAAGLILYHAVAVQAPRENQKGCESLRSGMGTVLRAAPRRQTRRTIPRPAGLAPAVARTKRTLSSLSGHDPRGDRMAQPSQYLAIVRGNGPPGQPGTAPSQLPPPSPSPTIDRNETASRTGRQRGLSRVRRKAPARF